MRRDDGSGGAGGRRAGWATGRRCTAGLPAAHAARLTPPLLYSRIGPGREPAGIRLLARASPARPAVPCRSAVIADGAPIRAAQASHGGCSAGPHSPPVHQTRSRSQIKEAAADGGVTVGQARHQSRQPELECAPSSPRSLSPAQPASMAGRAPHMQRRIPYCALCSGAGRAAEATRLSRPMRASQEGAAHAWVRRFSTAMQARLKRAGAHAWIQGCSTAWAAQAT
jgi:hypothetical protein